MCGCHAGGDTAFVGIVVTLEVDGKPVTVPDPSGGSCDAAGDFDRLLPFSADLPVLSRIDPYDTVILRGDDLGQLAVEVDRVLPWPLLDQNGADLLACEPWLRRAHADRARYFESLETNDLRHGRALTIRLVNQPQLSNDAMSRMKHRGQRTPSLAEIVVGSLVVALPIERQSTDDRSPLGRK
jgi:hypothetical protein